MNSQQELRNLLDGVSGAFSPVAYYDKFMDTIRIELRDCSSYEVRLDDTLTIMMANYPESPDEEFSGLVIKGIGHLFEQLGIAPSGVLKVVDLFNRMIEAGFIKEESVSPVKQTAGMIGMQVDFEDAIAA